MRKHALLLISACLLVSQLWAQKTISGKVTNQQGEPLPGVSVVVKGTNTGTTTKNDGTYSLTVPSNAGTLIFSSVDMEAQEVAISSSSSLSVTMLPMNKSLDEVVMVAYGTVKRSEFVGSAAQVTGEQLQNRPISNALTALVGAAPGIQTTTPSGAPGSSPGILIRGIGSYSLSSGPLYVVDGVIYDGGFSNINPVDIETITVLKDATTTALYGSKGANGVVMITTKKARKGRQSLQFRVQMGYSNPAIPRYPTVNAYEYYPLAWESYRNALFYGSGIPMDSAGMIASGTLPRITSGANAGNQIFRNGNYQDIYQVLGKYNPFNVGNTEIVAPDGTFNPIATLLYGDDLDWLDQATRTGSRQEYSLFYSAATDKSDLTSSFGYLKENGWGLRSDLTRFSGRVNVNATPTDWFKGGFNLAANRSKFNNSSTGGYCESVLFCPLYRSDLPRSPA